MSEAFLHQINQQPFQTRDPLAPVLLSSLIAPTISRVGPTTRPTTPTHREYKLLAPSPALTAQLRGYNRKSVASTEQAGRRKSQDRSRDFAQRPHSIEIPQIGFESAELAYRSKLIMFWRPLQQAQLYFCK